MKNGGKNKSVSFLIVFSVYIYIYICICMYGNGLCPQNEC